MYKITFKVQGTNVLEALQRLQTIGLDPTYFAGDIKLKAEDYVPVMDVLKDIHITDWSAVLQD